MEIGRKSRWESIKVGCGRREKRRGDEEGEERARKVGGS